VLHAGHGSLGIEVLEDVPEVDVVVVPVGGGGLISGVATALKACNPTIEVIGVESSGAPGMTRSVREGRLLTLTRSQTGSVRPSPGGTLACRSASSGSCRRRRDRRGRFYGRPSRLRPAGAATTAALLAGKVPLEPGERVVAVVSGGNVAPETASAILASR
jgi:threonine dehydratase